MRRRKIAAWLGFAALAAVTCETTEAAVLSDALLVFPSDTKYVEYDNLFELRKLPTYQALRKQYTGAALQQTLLSFRKLGIAEEDIEEVVMASDGLTFFGIALGTYSGTVVRKSAAEARLTQVAIHKEPVLCPAGPACVWFLDDSTSVFGTQTQIRRMIEARDGRVSRITENPILTDLLTPARGIAPVFGAASGSEIINWLGDGIPKSVLSTSGLTNRLSSIQWFSYKVSFLSTIHAELKLVCASESDASMLRQALNAFMFMQQVSATVGVSPTHFDHASLSSTGTLVALTTDVVEETK